MAFLMHVLQNTWPHVVVTSFRPDCSNCEARSKHTGQDRDDLLIEFGAPEEDEGELGERELVVGVEACSEGCESFVEGI